MMSHHMLPSTAWHTYRRSQSLFCKNYWQINKLLELGGSGQFRTYFHRLSQCYQQ